MTVRVLLADDQALLREGFAMILGAEADIQIVGSASDGNEAVRLASALSPDVVLMDVRMPGAGGIDATRRIVAAQPSVRIIILTTFDLDEYAFEGLRAGASGFLLKNARPEELISGVRSVAAGEAVLAPTTTRRLLDTYAAGFTGLETPAPTTPDVLGELTQREREVFDEIVAGLTNKEIAARLFLSEATVKTHVVRILSKLDLRDRIQAVILAYESGIAPSGR